MRTIKMVQPRGSSAAQRPIGVGAARPKTPQVSPNARILPTQKDTCEVNNLTASADR